MRRFGYLSDPLFLISCVLYVINRWGIKPHVSSVFFHNWFADILLIPCAMPPLLLVHRWLKLRPFEGPPTFLEIATHLLGWSLLFEVIGPIIMPHTTGDWRDVLAYAGGAVVAYVWWNREQLFHRLRVS